MKTNNNLIELIIVNNTNKKQCTCWKCELKNSFNFLYPLRNAEDIKYMTYCIIKHCYIYYNYYIKYKKIQV